MSFYASEDGPVTKPLPLHSASVTNLNDRRELDASELLLAAQSNIAQHVQMLQADLAYMAGGVDGNTEATDLVKEMGLAAEAIREKLRPLRNAIWGSGEAA